MRIFALVFLLFLLTACSQREERFRHIRNLPSVSEGDSPNEVVRKMQAKPDRIVYSDSMHYYQEQVYDLMTFIYLTPRGASSNIHIYFQECEVFYVYYD